MNTTKPPVLTDELDPRLIGWLRACQDWPHVLLDQTAVRQVIAVLDRAGADAVRDAALEKAAETCEQYQGSAETCADAIRALKGTPAAAVADAQVVSNIRVGNLPTMNQDEYPGLGDWWVQLRIGADSDEVLARVYGNSPQQAVERARRLAAQPSAQAQPSVNAGEVADHEWIEVPEIGNYYGCLRVKREQGVDYWSIENYDGDHWYECDPAVANAIRAAIAASKGAKP